MKRKLVWFLMAATVFLSACTGSKGTESGGSGPGAGGAAKEVTLELWDPDSREAWGNAVKVAIQKFEAENQGVKIKIANVPFGDYDTKLQASRVSKTLPDIVYTFRGYASDWAIQGMTTPLDDVLSKVGRNKFNDAQLLYATYNGKVYALPSIVYPHIVFYRKDWYAEKGLKVPTTWEELMSNVKALHDGKDRYGFLLYNKHPDPLVLLDIMATNGAYTFDKDGKVAINSPETIEALKFVGELAKYSPPGSVTKTQQEQRTAFAANLGAHIITSTSMADILNSTPALKDKVGAFPLPIHKGDRGALSEFAGWGVTETSKNKDLAKKFLETFFRDDVYVEFAKSAVIGHLPAVTTVTASDAYWNHDRIKPFTEIFKSGLTVTKNGEMPGQRFGPNQFSGSVLSQQVWSNMVDNVVVKGMTAEAAVAQADKEVKEIVK